jgi:predicted metal-dependent hydrolase
MSKFKVIVEKKWQLLGWRLRIVDNKTVKITVGVGINWEKIIKEKEEWILKNLKRVKKVKKLTRLKTVEILGEKYLVNISKGRTDSLNIFEEKKEIYIRAKVISESHLKKLIDKKMRPMALKIIREETKNLAEINGIKYGTVKIKNQKTRFGSCSGRGNLNFNWQIILFPKDKCQHVILHELNHILIKNHSRKFWEKLKEMDKESTQNNVWLKKEGPKRFLI